MATGAINRRKAPDRRVPLARPGHWNELKIHVEEGEVRVFVGAMVGAGMPKWVRSRGTSASRMRRT